MKYYLSMLLVGSVLMLSSSLVNADSCCISGTYKGEHSDTPSKTCKEPKTEKFIMVINQKACGTTITGEVTDARGDVSNMLGEVGGGCVITGTVGVGSLRPRVDPRSIRAASETTAFKGTMVKILAPRKWQVTDGTYKSSEGCKGTFKMQQE